jgi:hypothetical protein
MRDRLIELIGEYHAHPERFCPRMETDQPCSGCKYDLGFDCDQYGKLADHLLANGVIVPPVELGSRHKVYYPVKCTTVILETKVYGIGVDEDGNTILNPIEYPEKVISMIGVVLGKDVFLTREKAEKALAEREGKG